MVGSSSKGIVEVREEAMVSPAGGDPTFRRAHFIKPCTDSVTGPFSNLHSLCLSSLPTTFDPKSWAMNVKFNGWRYPPANWTTWVKKMASLHESTWRKAGIYEPIMNSTYIIPRADDLVLGVAERWFNETKSFIFPWGEATMTLEDVMILGGYTVLGSPVFINLETDELKEKKKKLEEARTKLFNAPGRKASQALWMKKFMDTDSEIEHEAFLVSWLSRFVFPSQYDVIVRRVFPVAVHLARGTRIALAPAVLANIYRDLSCLKEMIVATRELQSDEKSSVDGFATITLWSPLQLVQVWVWERFSELRPEPYLIKNGEPRLARWNGLKWKAKNVRSFLDSTKACFDWRPYAKTLPNCKLPKFYGECEMWVSVDSGLGIDDEVLSFAQCLSVSKLVGLDSVELYLPHRVSMQFGIDQDLPDCVAESNESPETAWSNYIKPIKGRRLYIPSRFVKAQVTTRYLEWWKESVLSVQKQKGSKNSDSTVEKHKGVREEQSFLSFETKKLKRGKKDSTLAGSSSVKILKSSALILRLKEKGSNTTSALSIARKMNLKQKKNIDHAGPSPEIFKSPAQSSKGKEEDGALILLESPLKNLKGSVGCSEGKRKTINTPLLDVDSDSSTSSVCVLLVKREENSNSASPSLPFRTSKEALDDRAQRELDNSPIPPGYPPKGQKEEAKGFVDEDCMIIREVLRSSSKHDNDFEKPTYLERHSLDTFNEDQLTIEEMLRSRSKIDKVECKEAESLSSDSVLEDQLTLAELLRSRNKIDRVECKKQCIGRNSSSPCQRPLSLTTGIRVRGRMRCVELPTASAEKLKPCEVVIGGSNPMGNDNCSPDHRTVGFNEKGRDGNSHSLIQGFRP